MADLDSEAVKAASKVMQALQAEQEARMKFDDALSEAIDAGANVQIVRDDLKARRTDNSEMMNAAQEHRQAEKQVHDALTNLLTVASRARYLQMTAPVGFVFGTTSPPEEEKSVVGIALGDSEPGETVEVLLDSQGHTSHPCQHPMSADLDEEEE